MKGTTPWNILPRHKNLSQSLLTQPQASCADSVKTEPQPIDHIQTPQDHSTLPDIYDSESEEEIHINFKDIGSNIDSTQYISDTTPSQKVSNDSISSLTEVDKIIQEIKNLKDPSHLEQKIPPRKKRICKKRKILQEVQVGEFFVGRLKKRDPIKPKVTFKDVNEIYRCQCGKDYLSYMGIYRHIKTIHLRKDQYHLFKLHTYKDSYTGKTIKTVIIQREEKSNTEYQNQRQKTPFMNQTRNVAHQRSNLKFEEGEIDKSYFQLNFDEAIQSSRQVRQVPETFFEPTISMSKYEKLIEDYRKIIDQMFEKDKKHLQTTQRLMQQNSMLYQVKEKYKLKLKLLEAKLQAQKIRLENTDQSVQNTTRQQDSCLTSGNDKTIFSFSETQEQTLQLPQFSTLNISNQSEYGSQIQEVFSLGVKNKQKQKSSKQSLQYSFKNGKALLFDPEIQENGVILIGGNRSKAKVKSEDEDEETQDIKGHGNSNKTSQKTAYFKGNKSQTQTEYEYEEGKIVKNKGLRIEEMFSKSENRFE